MELLQTMAGIRLHHIPYNGSPAALTDLMAGRIPLMMRVLTTAHAQWQQMKREDIEAVVSSRNSLRARLAQAIG